MLIRLILILMINLFLVSPLLAVPLFRANTEHEIRKTLEELPKNGKERAKATLYADLGFILYKQGNMYDASEAYEKSLTFRPSKITRRHVYRFLGKCYEATGRMGKAIESYESAVEYDRRNWRRHRDLAINYERAKLYGKAIHSYRKALKYNSKEASIFFALAQIYRKIGLYHEAEKNLVQSLEYGYNSTPVFNELSLAFEGLGRYDEAAAALNEVTTSESAISDWGRLIYLSVLAKNNELVEAGMSGLYKKTPNGDTVKFYESMVDVSKQNPSKILQSHVKNKYLQSLIDGVID